MLTKVKLFNVPAVIEAILTFAAVTTKGLFDIVAVTVGVFDTAILPALIDNVPVVTFPMVKASAVETVTVGVLETAIFPADIERVPVVILVTIKAKAVETVTVGVFTIEAFCVPPGVKATTETEIVDWSLATTTGNEAVIAV